MHWSSQIAVTVALTLGLWGLGYAWPPFALPFGQLLLVLLWGFAPWWAVIPSVGFLGLLLFETFGPAYWPYALTLGLSSIIAIVMGNWWRAGRGWSRPLIATPLLLIGPWLLLRLIVGYSPFAATHLGWLPPGLLSMALLWGGVHAVRNYQPRRRSYRLGVYQ